MEKIVGVFERTIFRNNSNYYTVASFSMEKPHIETIIVVGHIDNYEVDYKYELNGDFTDHIKYGIQFNFKTFNKILPTDKENTIKYLSSSVFVGIGEKTAEKIVEQIGDNTIEKLKNNQELISSLSISERQKQSLFSGLFENKNDLENIIVYFSQLGLSVNLILKIEQMYQEKSIEVVLENPYKLSEEISGIGFKTADGIAKKIGFDLNSVYRKEAMIINIVLNHLSQTGDSYLTKALLEKTYLKYFSDSFDEALFNLLTRRVIILEDDLIYHHTQYDSESIIAYTLSKYLDNTNDVNVKSNLVSVESNLNIEYDNIQQQAIFEFFKNDILVLTGGPGTGKTTIIQAMIEIYKDKYPNEKIALCAPTGRAAKRLSELCNHQAFTIHSLLKWDIDTNTFKFDYNNPLDYDVLIVDEFSMVDQWLFSKLLVASSKIKKILLVGDKHQLPSVLPGAILSDLIKSNYFKVITLEKIYRQKEGSNIVYLADKINKNKYSEISFTDEVSFLEVDNNQVDNHILKTIESFLKKGFNINDIQVLAPMYKKASGIDILNKKIQNIINPQAKDKKELKYGYTTFRENDKLLQLKNRVDQQVFNGDIGTLVEIEDFGEKALYVDYEDNIVEYTYETFNDLTHAYCISIHKSQGSEYPVVIMPIVSSHLFMLRKRLLYTGLSRAKKHLVFVGDKNLFLERIEKNDLHQRNTTLIKQLNKVING